MAEWLVEQGIGEERALLVEDGEVLAARVRWPGELYAGAICEAQLVSKPSGAMRGMAVDLKGREILLDRIPPGTTEGQAVGVRIARAAIAERGRLKRAQGQVIGAELSTIDGGHGPMEGRAVYRFPVDLWEDVWESANTGSVAFPGGTLLFSLAPAMTVVDIDGDLPPRELALAAVPPLARWLRIFDLGGSIGIDFPTLATKADRKAVDAALDEALADWPHERTAMNGFGFVHVVARLEGPSLLHRIDGSRLAASARMVLRRAERVDEPGTILLTVHPALKAKLKPEWLDELARRSGREVRIATDPALAIERGFAQAVTS